MIKKETKYLKSCLNYTGGKYKLLNQIMPLFPDKINNFIDLFCGGANISINMNVEGSIKSIDKQKQVINLFNTLKKHNIDEVLDVLNEIMTRYNLSNTKEYGYNKYKSDSSKGLALHNKNSFLSMREDYNNRMEDSMSFDLMFYMLTVYGFNNQIRFSKKGRYNIPVGKRDFNSNIKKNLENFMHSIKEKDIDFVNKDFREMNIELVKDDFLYADPPYLISTATYNEQNGWTIKDEEDLLKLLDSLNKKGVKFALSNVLEHKGVENIILKKWAKNYKIHNLNYNYRNSNYQTKKSSSSTLEVLITNY